MTAFRLGIALAVGLALVGGLWYLTSWGSVTAPWAPRVLLVDASAAVLDTVRLEDRRVSATLNGTVAEVATDGTVWLNTGGDAFPLRFPEEAGLEVEDRALVTGRLRARSGQRWIDVDAWSHVRGQAQ